MTSVPSAADSYLLSVCLLCSYLSALFPGRRLQSFVVCLCVEGHTCSLPYNFIFTYVHCLALVTRQFCLRNMWVVVFFSVSNMLSVKWPLLGWPFWLEQHLGTLLFRNHVVTSRSLSRSFYFMHIVILSHLLFSSFWGSDIVWSYLCTVCILEPLVDSGSLVSSCLFLPVASEAVGHITY